MNRFLLFVLVILNIIVFPAIGARAWWQSIQQISISAGSSFQGPGDVVAGATAWGSCARAYNAAYANGTNPLCDLKDKTTGTVAICTLRVLTTGFVDLVGSYCVGSTTPSAACAAAAGGACIVSKAYDQTGNGNHFTNATVAQMPPLAFNALGGLPGLLTANATVSILATGNLTIAQPFTFSAVANRTAVVGSTTSIIGAGTSANVAMGWPSTTGLAQLSAGSFITATAANTTFHAMQGIINGAAPNSILTIDGLDTTGSSGAGTISAEPVRLVRGGGSGTPDGNVMEGGIWPNAFDGTQRTNMNTNQHSAANGYNF